MALTKPFAENGNKLEIPETTADGSVSYDQGFGSFYALPPEEGGLFIDRAQFNQLMYDTTSAVIENNQSITQINSKFSLLAQPASVKITLGDSSSGADFQTLDDALAEASKYFGNKLVEITLLSDITINKKYDIGNNLLNNIAIVGDGTRRTINLDTAAQLNFWSCLFFLKNINFKTTQANIYSVRALNTARGTIDTCSFDGSATAITCRNSFLGIIACEFTNISTACINNYRNGVIDCSYLTINANTASLLNQNQGGIASVDNTVINTQFTTSKYNIAANTLTRDGIIFDID
jgi:hypothetical protein